MKPSFPLALNTSTIRCQKQPLPELIQAAAATGYNGIEPWVNEIEACDRTTSELARQCDDAGLSIINLIAFFEWAVPDGQRRSAGFDQARRTFELAAHLGCPKVAAPPWGFNEGETLDLDAMADHYATLIQIGREYHVTPILEFWGMSPVFSQLAQAIYVATKCGQPEACLLLDPFHLHKAGSPFEGTHLLAPGAIGLIHLNDYPAAPDRASITDADRIWPGDGVAPLAQTLATLYANGYRGWLSLELFNAQYWTLPPIEAAKIGLQKMHALLDSIPTTPPANPAQA